jgi:SAM-dependent methyltransferase
MTPLGEGTASDDTPIAPDGSPVGLYRAFPPGHEPAIIHEAIPSEAVVLELGCGAGRITHPLIALGHPVVAVDQSADMLAHVRGARTFLADIEDLELSERFSAVVLSSYLVNTAVPGQREAFLQACRRHVSADGVLLVQRTSPTWAASLRPGHVVHSGQIIVTITEAILTAGILRATQECRTEETTWTHSWVDMVHSDSDFVSQISRSGFILVRWLDDDHEWALLRPAHQLPA